MKKNTSWVLLAGGAGYVGTQMAYTLIEAGYAVIVVDNLSRDAHPHLPKDVVLYQIDIKDTGKLDAIFSKYDISCVMDFSAFIHVGESVQWPDYYYQNNVFYTLNLLMVMKKHGVRYLMFSSSAAVFGEPAYLPVNEAHPKNPMNPYGRSKWICEMILEDMSHAYGLCYGALRYFNIAGADPEGRSGFCERDATNLIPIILNSIFDEDQQLTVFGADYDTRDGTCLRDYIHVKDICLAQLALMESLFLSDKSVTYNVGSGKGYTILEVIGAIQKITGKKIPYQLGERRAGDPARVIADISRISSDLSWLPRYSDLDQMIGDAWRWITRA